MLKICLLMGLMAMGSVTALGVPGGVTVVDLGADATSLQMKGLMDAAHWATERICEGRNSPVHMKFIKLTHATEQVVQGMKYGLTMQIGETDCLKREVEMSACLQSPQPHHNTIECTATVWSRPWLSDWEKMQFIGEFNCSG